MHGLPFTADGFDKFSEEELLRLQRDGVQGFAAQEIARRLQKFEDARLAKHRSALESNTSVTNEQIARLHAEVTAIKIKQAEPDKPEWKTISLWVAVIALGWQVGEKVPWRSLLQYLKPAAAASANESIQPSSSQPLQSDQKSPSESKSEAPVESSPPKATTESPLLKTPAEHPKE